MTTRSRVTVRKSQPRKARTVNVAVSDLSHASNTFAGLPYDVKYHLLHEFHFTPSELLSLSHINRSWRECAIADSLWCPWFETFPKETKAQLRSVANVSKRDFVMLGLTHKCKGCGAWAGLISAPLMLRLCGKCLVDDPAYRCVDINTRRIYDLTLGDVKGLVSSVCGLDKNGEKRPKVPTWIYVSERCLINIAIQKHGGTFESMTAHTAALQLRAKEDHARKLALFEEERSAALAQNLPFRKRAPRNTQELSWSLCYNNDSAPMSSSISLEALCYKDGDMRCSDSFSCLLCKVELAELYRVQHGVDLSSLKHRTNAQECEWFKMRVSCVPECREDYDILDMEHYANHFETIAWKNPCPDDCKAAARESGEGTCEPCCKERALRKHLGDQVFNEEMNTEVYDLLSDSDSDYF